MCTEIWAGKTEIRAHQQHIQIKCKASISINSDPMQLLQQPKKKKILALMQLLHRPLSLIQQTIYRRSNGQCATDDRAYAN
jgi:hypothetical protein